MFKFKPNVHNIHVDMYTKQLIEELKFKVSAVINGNYATESLFEVVRADYSYYRNVYNNIYANLLRDIVNLNRGLILRADNKVALSVKSLKSMLIVIDKYLNEIQHKA